MYTIEEFEREKSKVMNYIMYKKRTEYEVKNKFQSTIQKDMLCDIIYYVKDAGYLNDKDYVERAISEFIALKNISIKEIEYKLYQKGISKDILEDYIYENNDELLEHELKSAECIYEKKKNTMDKEDIKKYLMRKGYKQQIIKEVLE